MRSLTTMAVASGKRKSKYTQQMSSSLLIIHATKSPVPGSPGNTNFTVTFEAERELIPTTYRVFNSSNPLKTVPDN